jgi:hypothetical protein
MRLSSLRFRCQGGSFRRDRKRTRPSPIQNR